MKTHLQCDVHSTNLISLWWNSETESSREIDGIVCKKYCPISEKGVCNRKTIIEQLSVL